MASRRHASLLARVSDMRSYPPSAVTRLYSRSRSRWAGPILGDGSRDVLVPLARTTRHRDNQPSPSMVFFQFFDEPLVGLQLLWRRLGQSGHNDGCRILEQDGIIAESYKNLAILSCLRGIWVSEILRISRNRKLEIQFQARSTAVKECKAADRKKRGIKRRMRHHPGLVLTDAAGLSTEAGWPDGVATWSRESCPRLITCQSQ
jgi:hypothetical protein